ncbi:uncharacterized protein LOC108681749 [Hyalella azteca]|uniref:Uncharacterized protein LOC108681749 n=1 Tax=Hyalella azteca TaxID=294128 RepID=A0A979FFR0_HYAAZ|nr:uncharacterized protein LOC108681749 [Hyalella azteca]
MAILRTTENVSHLENNSNNNVDNSCDNNNNSCNNNSSLPVTINSGLVTGNIGGHMLNDDLNRNSEGNLVNMDNYRRNPNKETMNEKFRENISSRCKKIRKSDSEINEICSSLQSDRVNLAVIDREARRKKFEDNDEKRRDGEKGENCNNLDCEGGKRNGSRGECGSKKEVKNTFKKDLSEMFFSKDRTRGTLRLLVLLLVVVLPRPAIAVVFEKLEVSIPPSLVAGPAGGEVLYTVNHDPMKDPDPLTLPCHADGIPTPQYAWLKNGEPWEPPPGAVNRTDGVGTITFLDPRPEDEGTYQCVANNSAGVLYTDVAVLRRSLLGYFPSLDARVVTLNLGEPLTLPCTPPVGYPPPSTTWLLQSEDGGLRNLENSRISIDGAGTLRFAYVVASDATEDAFYACAASSATSAHDLYVVRDAKGDLSVTDVKPAADGSCDVTDDDVTSITIP